MSYKGFAELFLEGLVLGSTGLCSSGLGFLPLLIFNAHGLAASISLPLLLDPEHLHLVNVLLPHLLHLLPVRSPQPLQVSPRYPRVARGAPAPKEFAWFPQLVIAACRGETTEGLGLRLLEKIEPPAEKRRRSSVEESSHHRHCRSTNRSVLPIQSVLTAANPNPKPWIHIQPEYPVP